MNQEITVSVALVTRNRPAWLRRCLTSWRNQTTAPLEIVVSDDSDESFRAENQQIAQAFGARWHAGPRRGLYANRNAVAAHCRGSHIFSADDDHEHPADFLERCLEVLRADPASAWCVGEALSWEEARAGWTPATELKLYGASNRAADPDHTWAWSDGATLCPRAVFDRGLRFYDGFRFGWAYLEFGCLLHATGQRIRLVQTTGFVHHMNASGRSFQIPVEEWASSYFALIMLAWVYQPSLPHRARNLFYFLRQIVRRPVIFCRSLPRALAAVRERRRWLRLWREGQTASPAR